MSRTKGKAPIISDKDFKRTLTHIRGKAQETKRNTHAERNIAIMYCSHFLMLRAKEIAELELSQIVDSQGRLLDAFTLTNTKGGKPRELYLTNKELRKALMNYIEYRKGLPYPKLFVSICYLFANRLLRQNSIVASFRLFELSNLNISCLNNPLVSATSIFAVPLIETTRNSFLLEPLLRHSLKYFNSSWCAFLYFLRHNDSGSYNLAGQLFTIKRIRSG